MTPEQWRTAAELLGLLIIVVTLVFLAIRIRHNTTASPLLLRSWQHS